MLAHVLTERFCTTVEFFYTWPVFESSSESVTSAMLNALLGHYNYEGRNYDILVSVIHNTVSYSKKCAD